MVLPSITITGRLTRDPQARFTNTGKAVTTLSVAANEYRQRNGEWEQTGVFFVDAEVWDAKAEQVNELNLQRGQSVIVHGQFYTHQYETKDGARRSEPLLRVWAVAPLPEQERQQQQQESPARQQDSPPATATGYSDEPPF